MPPRPAPEHDCLQEGALAALTDAVRTLTSTAQRHEELQMRTLTSLEAIAEQGAYLKALMHRQDKQEKDLAEVFPRLRVVEDGLTALRTREDARDKLEQEHSIDPRLRTVEKRLTVLSEFQKTHDKASARNDSLTLYIKGGLGVAGILALAAFMLYLYAHSGYSGAPAVVESRAQKKGEAK